MNDGLSAIERTVLSDYKYGFVTDIEADSAPKGLSEDTIRFISAKKNETKYKRHFTTRSDFFDVNQMWNCHRCKRIYRHLSN